MNHTNSVALVSVAVTLSMLLLLPSWAQGPTRVRVVTGAAPSSSTGLYTPDRDPLRPTAFMKLPVGSITPHGWLRHQLELDANGLCGQMEEISNYLKYDGNGWVDP